MPPSFLETQAVAMLRQQLIRQIIESGSGGSLADSLFERRQKTGRQISAEAITGRIRSDAGMLRQASRNAGEGADIAKTANAATSSLLTSLGQMRDLAATMASTGVNAPGAVDSYNALAAGIQNTINTTAYNGISLMNKNKWPGDDRLTVSSDGTTASLPIQVGTSSRPLVLTDFSGILSGVGDGATALDNAASAQDAANQLSGIISTVQMQDRTYAAMASSFASESKSIKRQSKLLDETAARNIPGPQTDPLLKLLYNLLSNQGNVLDSAL